MSDKLRFGEILVRAGVLDRNTLERMAQVWETRGGDLGELLVERNVIDEALMLQTIGKSLNVPVVRLSGLDPDPQAVEKLPLSICERHVLVPVEVEQSKTGAHLHVAMANPADIRAIKDVTRTARLRIRPLVAAAREIRDAIKRYYSEPGGRAASSGSIAIGTDDLSAAGRANPKTPQPASSSLFDFGTDFSAQDEPANRTTLSDPSPPISRPPISRPPISQPPPAQPPPPVARLGSPVGRGPRSDPSLKAPAGPSLRAPSPLSGATLHTPPPVSPTLLRAPIETPEVPPPRGNALPTPPPTGPGVPLPPDPPPLPPASKPPAPKPPANNLAARSMPPISVGPPAGDPALLRPRSSRPPGSLPPLPRAPTPSGVVPVVAADGTPVAPTAGLDEMIDDREALDLRTILDHFVEDISEVAEPESEEVIAQLIERFGRAPTRSADGDFAALDRALGGARSPADRLLIGLIRHLARRGLVDPTELVAEIKKDLPR